MAYCTGLEIPSAQRHLLSNTTQAGCPRSILSDIPHKVTSITALYSALVPLYSTSKKYNQCCVFSLLFHQPKEREHIESPSKTQAQHHRAIFTQLQACIWYINVGGFADEIPSSPSPSKKKKKNCFWHQIMTYHKFPGLRQNSHATLTSVLFLVKIWWQHPGRTQQEKKRKKTGSSCHSAGCPCSQWTCVSQNIVQKHPCTFVNHVLHLHTCTIHTNVLVFRHSRKTPASIAGFKSNDYTANFMM